MSGRRCARPALLGLLVGLAALPAAGGGTREWVVSPAELGRGEADGVAVSRNGRLFPAPRLNRLSEGASSPDAGQVLALAVDRSGALYLGTSPGGQILKISSGGRSQLLFTADEPLVTALALTSAGDLFAATAPGGKIYRVRPDGSGEVWSETGERYVWSLVARDDGTLFAATGERGRILEIDGSGSAEIFFDSNESHIVSLVAAADGGLIAGGAGRGLVYHIDENGNAHVLYDDELDEVVALSPESDGSLLAAFVAAPPRVSRPPALRLRLPDGTQVGGVDESVSLDDSDGPTLRGIIEGLPQAPRAPRGRRGRLVRIAPDGAFEELWASSTEAPFCLVRDSRNRPLMGTGAPARLYRVDAGDDVSLLATLREAQLTQMIPAGRSLFLATSNPAATYRLETETAEEGVFLSPTFDAGAPARWGTVRWALQGSTPRVEIYTRTGNSERPDATWSAWSPAQVVPDGSPIENPDGRYLQWRARFVGSGAGDARLSRVSLHFEPYNRPPEIDEFRLDGRSSAVAGAAEFRWSARDADGDPVAVLLEYRKIGSGAWNPLPAEPTIEVDGLDSGTGWNEDRSDWNTATAEEGRYEVRAVASDEAYNHPGEGHRVPAAQPLRLTVDRTPPRIEVREIDGDRVEVELTDRLSDLRRLEVVVEGRPLYSVRSVDGVCDSGRELFRFRPPAGAAWSLRASDAAGNTAEYGTTIEEGVDDQDS